MKFAYLIGLVSTLDIYVVTDGPQTTRRRNQWRQARDWIEYLFQYSAVLDHFATRMHFIDSRERGLTHHCSGTNSCSSRIRRLKFPHFDTYSSLKFLSQLKTKQPVDHLSRSVLLFITDGDVGADIEANCLTKPRHSLFIDDNKQCAEFFIELLYAMENFNSIKHFDSLILLSWRVNNTIPEPTVKLLDDVLQPQNLTVANLMNANDRYNVILELIKILGEEVNARRDETMKAKLLDYVTDH